MIDVSPGDSILRSNSGFSKLGTNILFLPLGNFLGANEFENKRISKNIIDQFDTIEKDIDKQAF